MKQKKEIKISLKIAIIIAIIIILLISIIGISIYINTIKGDSKAEPMIENDITKVEETTGHNQEDYEEIDINGKTYYHRLTKNTWNGEYHQDKYYTSYKNNKVKVVSYEDYINYINEINSNIEEEIKNYYTDENSNYIILSYANGSGWCDMELVDCIEEDNQIIIYGDESERGLTSIGSGYFIAIPTNMPTGTKIQYRECYTTSEIHENSPRLTIDKPIIYLYPTEETKVSVKLLKDKNLTCSYPKYKSGWNVLAQPNGNLRDLTTNRQLYSLYYESKSAIDFKMNNEGFIVKGEDAIKFLEEKFAILGLTEKETEEFIVYWLPKLESNKYNYIRFATLDEINENMPLSINPKPDTIIRVLMIFKGLDNPIDVKEQKLIRPDRTGFVAVEWGGTEIK